MAMKYKIECGRSPAQVAQDVREALRDGWELQGGIAISTENPHECWFAQALIKRDDQVDPVSANSFLDEHSR